MNPEIKAKLVGALRSGKYNKTEGRLFRREDGKDCHCCLGVLCDLAFEADVDGVIFDPDNKDCAYFGETEGNLLMPTSVYTWAGLSSGEATDFYRKNDNSTTHRTFEDLASWLEEDFIDELTED